MSLENLQEFRKESITVGFLVDECKDRFKLTSVNGAIGYDAKITDRNLHRPQLALAGYTKLFTHHRVQVFGNTEVYYLRTLDLEHRLDAFRGILAFELPCIVVTSGNELAPELIDLATAAGVAVLATPHETTRATYFLTDFLDDQFAPQVSVHGAFVDVYGVGVLFVGRSGIGKSEVALDLIERGHRLVADDVVMITKKGEGILMGSGTSLVKHFMEIRGLGLINVREMFGIRAIRYQKRVEIIVELEDWDRRGEYTRTGLDESNITVADVDIQTVKLPIFPGKNITVIAEVIALNYLLKHYGYDAAREFSNKLEEVLQRRAEGGNERATNYFEHDFE
jgi:HPr kinase/phosphorylase